MSRFHLLFLAWGARFWYAISQFLTSFGGEAVQRYPYATHIADALQYGRRYRKDGLVDWMVHPTRVQDRLNSHQRAGDCEDHMGYWLAALHRSRISNESYAGFLYYTVEGKREGHAVAIFKGRDGQYYWADYFSPQVVDDLLRWEDAAMMGRPSDSNLVGSILFRVTVSPSGTIHFKSPVCKQH